ncbi:MAG: hypothetical protein ABSE80_09715 [Halobacteriota archaeon]
MPKQLDQLHCDVVAAPGLQAARKRLRRAQGAKHTAYHIVKN